MSMHQPILYDVLERLNRMEILLAQLHWKTFATEQFSGSTFYHTTMEQLDPSAPGPVDIPSPTALSSSKKRRLRAAAVRRNLWAKASAATNAVYDTVPDAVFDAAPGPDVIPHAVPDAISSPVSDNVPGAVSEVVPDAAPDAVPGFVPDAVPDAVSVDSHETSEHMRIPGFRQSCRALASAGINKVASTSIGAPQKLQFPQRRRHRNVVNMDILRLVGRDVCITCNNTLMDKCFCEHNECPQCVELSASVAAASS